MALYESLSGKTSVEVLTGKFGRYVKLTRGGEKPRWLNVGEPVWRALDYHLEEIYARMTGSLEELILAPNWTVTIQEYRDKRYVCLKQYVGQFINRMNFALDDWDALMALNGDVMKALTGPEPSIDNKKKNKRCEMWPTTIDVYRVPGYIEIYGTERQARKRYPDIEPEKITIDTITSGELVKLIGRNIFTGELLEIRKETCNGCKVDHPSQMQHTCLMDDWNADVNVHYEDIKTRVQIDDYSKRVPTVFDTLVLPLNLTKARNAYVKDVFKEAMKEG